MSNLELLTQILSSRNEDQVKVIIETNPTIFSGENWKPIGDNDNNFGQIDAQGKNPERALIEKITNSIDAVLLRECKRAGLDPNSSNAPNSVTQAVETFFNIKDGDLSNIDLSLRDKLASQIYVISENLYDKRSNFYIIDKGEGQEPENFTKTFLKFGGNKADTYFVHGRFGTGSFGVLPNAGDEKYQLIISKSFNKIEGDWGWTLIRKNRPTDPRVKHAWYEYLTINKSIPTVRVDDMAHLLRHSINYPKLDLVSLEHGTIIKIFNYDIPNSSDIDRELFRIINRYLFSPALPFRILNAQGTGNVGPGKEVEGNINRLRKNHQELETGDKLQIKEVLIPKLGKVNIDIYISKKRELKRSYIESEKVSTKKEAVFFLRNGQSHGELERSFLADEIGLGYIAKDMAVYIDCTETPSADFDDVFPPTRDSLRENRHRNVVEKVLRKELKEFEALQEINQTRKSQIISTNISKTKDLQQFVSDLFALDPTLQKLLSGSLLVPNQVKRGPILLEPYLGKRFPTFLKIKDYEITKLKVKTIPVNTYTSLVLETDAQNDYFFREEMPGELICKFSGSMNSYKLYNGHLTLRLYPQKDQNPESEEKVIITLTRPQDTPLNCEFLVKYAKPIQLEPKPSGPPPQPPNPTRTSNFQLPKLNSVNAKQWREAGWDEGDVCFFDAEKDLNSNQYILKEISINEDFPRFKEYVQSQNIQAENKIQEMKEQFVQSVYLSSLFVFKGYSQENFKRERAEETMKYIAQCLPLTLFTLQKRWIRNLSSLESSE